jgi:tetratricopeptide (TPR) repeat protein
MNKEGLTEKYFSNRLSEAEFVQLQELLETDADFRESFYSELEVQQALAREKHWSIKQRFDKLDQKPLKKNNWYLYAAAIAVLIAVGTLFYTPTPNYQEVYASHFEVYPNVVNLTNRSDANEEVMSKEAFELYEAGEYREAAVAFEDVYRQQPEDYIHFYYGLSLMAAGDTEEGIQALDKYPWQETNSDFTTVVHWYMGLGYVKLGNITDARLYLKKVADGENSLSSHAREVLEELN